MTPQPSFTRFVFSLLCVLFTSVVVAQPANNTCSGAITAPQDGSCLNGTTVNATDNWTSTIGCQSGNGHPEVWYEFTADSTALALSVTNGTMTGDVEFILVHSTSDCNGTLSLEESTCGPSVLEDTISGLAVGDQYYFTISSSTASEGTFDVCTNTFGFPDLCTNADTIDADGSCFSGTTVGAADNLSGSVGCQSGDGHADLWYTFTADSTAIVPNISTGTMGGNIEVTILEGTCSSLGITGSGCGPAPLQDTISGLTIGTDYFMMISSDGADGTFTACPNQINPTAPGQDCPNAQCVADTSGFTVGSIANGSGNIFGSGSEEDMLNYATCFGDEERQSQWYTFTANKTGTIEFAVVPNNYNDDYDWVLFDITNSGCDIVSNSAPELACNWSGCVGSTGISSDPSCEDKVNTSGSCTNGGTYNAYDETPPTIQAGNTYALLIDNYTTSNNGFEMQWGGCTDGMTGNIGPIAQFDTTSINDCDVTAAITTPDTTNLVQYEWDWGDGTTTTNAGPDTVNHTYATTGTYTITLLTYDETGCSDISSLTIDVNCNKCEANITSLNDTIKCNYSQDTLNGFTSIPSSDSISYQWSTTGGNIVGSTTDTIAIVDQAGDYKLLINDTVSPGGCADSMTVTVEIDTTSPNASITAAEDTMTCATTSSSMDASGSTTNSGSANYSWATTGGNITSGTTSSSITFDSDGDYTVTVTDPINGCTGDTTFTIEIDTASPNAAISAAEDTLSCTTPNSSMDASGSTTNSGSIDYSWTTSGGNITSGTTSSSITFDADGDYTVTVTDPINGCTDDTTFSIEIDTASPNAAISASTDSITCAITSGTMDASSSTTNSGSIDYSWTASAGGNITSGTNSATISFDSDGDYTVTVTDPINSCTDDTTFSVAIDTTSPNATISASDDTLTCTTTSGTMDASRSTTNSGSINYSWAASAGGNITSGTNSATINFDSDGDYTVTVTDPVNGCTDDTTFTIEIDTASPNAAISAAEDTLSCATPSSSMDASGSTTNSGSASYSWTASAGGNITAGGTTSTINFDADGDYTVTVTDPVNGCTDDTTFTIEIDTVSPNSAISAAEDSITCTIDSIVLDGSGSTTNSGSINYSWTAANGGNITGTTTADTAVIDAAGDYTLTITDPINGCTNDTTFVIEESNDIPDATVTATADSLTCTLNSITLDASTSTTNSGNIDYSWDVSGGGNITGAAVDSSTIDVDATGSYLLTITDPSTSCIDDTTYTIAIDTISPNPTITATDDTLTCGTTSGTLDASGSFTSSGSANYSWTTSGGGNITSGTSSATADFNSDGNYTVTITDPDNGCTGDTTFTIEIDTASPTAAIAVTEDTLTCAITSSTMDASGSTTNSGSANYSWSASAGGNITSGTTSATINYNSDGDYTVTVTDPINGCTDDSTFTVAIDTASPNATITASEDTLTCNTPSAILDASNSTTNSGGADYSWTASGGGNITSGTTNDTISLNAAGDYTVTVIDPSNGCSDDTTFIVEIDTVSPNASIVSPTDTINCSTTSITLDGSGSNTNSGNISYSWSTSGGGNITGTTTADTAMIDAAGDYTLTITDGINGCTQDTTYTIEADNLIPQAAVTNATDTLTCLIGTITLDGSGSTTNSGNINYSWSASAGGNITGTTTADTAVIDAAGDYTLTVTDPANACTDDSTFSIVMDTASPSAAIGAFTNISCNDSTTTLDGSGSTTNSGNTQFNWTTSNGNIVSGASTSTITVDSTGDYTLTITDLSSGCTDDTTVSVSAVSGPTDMSITTSNETCGQSDGSISITNVTGGTTPYEYDVNGGGFTTDTNYTGLSGGNYTVTVQDSNNCTYSETVTISGQPGPSIDSSFVTVEMAECKKDNGSISNLLTSGGTQPYQYEWTDASGNALGSSSDTTSIDSLPSGDYTLTVTDANGCQVRSGPYSIISTGGPTADFSPSPSQGNVPLEVEFFNNSIGGDQYSWDFGNGATDTVFEPTTTYEDTGAFLVSLIVEDSVGCTDTAEKLVTSKGVSSFDMPNVFTPNGDGKNDVFKVMGDYLTIVEGTIYNRWGEAIFIFNSAEIGWDGRNSAGKPVPEGTYFYVIVAEGVDGETYEKQGSLMLTR